MRAVDFVAKRLSPLEAGEYVVTARQTVSGVDPAAISPTAFDAAPTHVVVTGPRTALPPSAIVGVYPPSGSTADHSTVLPHVRLTPATLPWQRSAKVGHPGDDAATRAEIRETPWLALLLFDADEAPQLQTVRRADLDGSTALPTPLPPEIGDSEDDPVAVIDVPYGLLAALLPDVGELSLLTHVRESLVDGTTTAAAVVLGNRLPPPGRTSTVHLVSVEHMAQRSPDWRYRTADLDDADLVRLVSLHHWSFSSAATERSFHGIAAALDRDPLSLRLPTDRGLRGRLSCTPDGAVVHTDELGEVVDPARVPQAEVVHDDGFGPAIALDGSREPRLVIERPLRSQAESFTITAWVKPRVARPAQHRPIVASLDPMTGQPGLWQDPDGGLFLVSGGEHLDRNRVADVFVADDTWVHVAWVRTASGEHVVVDGEIRATERPLVRDTSLGDAWIGTVGVAPEGVDGTFDGLLADVRIHGRALDVAEVRRIRTADRTHQPERAGAFTSRGLVPVEHRLRQGRTAVTWLRSPLSIDPTAALRRPAPIHADGWLDLHADIGMLDATLAAAWELGRQTMLSSSAAAAALYRWRRARRRLGHHAAHSANASHLPAGSPHPDFDPDHLPDEVQALLTAVARLDGLPANYLIPDPDLLPPESMRMVKVDPTWLDALVHGALSVGAQSSGDRLQQEELVEMVRPVPERWGFLLRSELVSNWPELVVALDAEPLTAPGDGPVAPLDVVAQREIVPGVLLVLCDGVPRTLTLHLAPEEIHCGVDTPDEGSALRLLLRGANGHLDGRVIDEVPLRELPAGASDRRVLRIGALRQAIADLNPTSVEPSPADMAVQLIAGVPQARFVVDDG